MKTLHTLKEKSKNLSNEFYVFDVETRGLRARPDAFIFGVIYNSFYKRVIYSVDEFKKELLKPRYNKKIVFAHNAEYDCTCLYGNIYDIDNKAIFNGKFIAANNGNCILADSMNIYPTSVANIGKILKINKQEIENEYITGEGEIKVTKKMIDYCTRDCEIVYKALLEIFYTVGNVKITLAGLSLDYFRRKFLDFHIDFNDLSDSFFESYFGGRTEAFKIGDVKACAYDLNSMYPDAMLNCVFPNPKHLKKVENVDIKRFLEYYLVYFEGMTEIEVIHKEHYFGFLPIKEKGKLMFPIGNIKGCYNFNELRFALENNIIEIKKINYVIYANRMLSPFKKFVTNLYSERKNSKNDLSKLILKLLLNSLYGKFAQKIQNEYVYIKDYREQAEIIADLKNSGKLIKIVPFSESRKDCFLLVKNDKAEKTYNSIPVFSSYITSHARIKLLKNLIKYKDYKPVYCDTDSIFFESDPKIKNSEKLGEWKKED